MLLGVVFCIDLAVFAFTWARVYPPDGHQFLNEAPHSLRLLLGGSSGASPPPHDANVTEAAHQPEELVRIADTVDMVCDSDSELNRIELALLCLGICMRIVSRYSEMCT